MWKKQGKEVGGNDGKAGRSQTTQDFEGQREELPIYSKNAEAKEALGLEYKSCPISWEHQGSWETLSIIPTLETWLAWTQPVPGYDTPLHILASFLSPHL